MVTIVHIAQTEQWMCYWFSGFGKSLYRQNEIYTFAKVLWNRVEWICASQASDILERLGELVNNRFLGSIISFSRSLWGLRFWFLTISQVMLMLSFQGPSFEWNKMEWPIVKAKILLFYLHTCLFEVIYLNYFVFYTFF